MQPGARLAMVHQLPAEREREREREKEREGERERERERERELVCVLHSRIQFSAEMPLYRLFTILLQYY